MSRSPCLGVCLTDMAGERGFGERVRKGRRGRRGRNGGEGVEKGEKGITVGESGTVYMGSW